MKLLITYIGLITIFVSIEATINRVIPNMFYQVDDCEGSELLVECPVGYYIEIADGLYGRTSTSKCVADGDNSVEEDKLPCTATKASAIHSLTSCNNQETCKVKVDAAEMGVGLDDCPGGRYLNVSFNCLKPLNEVHTCEEDTLILSCPGEEVIQIVDVMYGRNDAERCVKDDDPRNTNTDCYSAEAGWRVSDLCNHKPYCEVKASEPMFDDPCPETSKLLHVVYQCASCENQFGDDGKCDQYALRGECEMNPTWMLASCRKACWRCDSNMACRDKSDFYDCTQWASTGECLSNEKWMKENCQYTCNKCWEDVPEQVVNDGSQDDQKEELEEEKPVHEEHRQEKVVVNKRDTNFSDRGAESDGPGLKKYYSVIVLVVTVVIMGSMIIYLSLKPKSKKTFKKSA